MYDIQRSTHHVVRIPCYDLYLSCLCPMKTWHVNEIWDGKCYKSLGVNLVLTNVPWSWSIQKLDTKSCDKFVCWIQMELFRRIKMSSLPDKALEAPKFALEVMQTISECLMWDNIITKVRHTCTWVPLKSQRAFWKELGWVKMKDFRCSNVIYIVANQLKMTSIQMLLQLYWTIFI